MTAKIIIGNIIANNKPEFDLSLLFWLESSEIVGIVVGECVGKIVGGEVYEIIIGSSVWHVDDCFVMISNEDDSSKWVVSSS